LEDRLKERLTGAVLLVALVVVLVPAMFRGERPDSTTAPAAPQSQQVYTIDLNGTAPGIPGEQPASSSAASAAAPALDAPPATMPAAGPPTAPAIPMAPAAAVSPPEAATAPAASTAPQPPPATKPAPKAPPAPRAATGSGFVVQVGSFSSRENASAMVGQAAKKGVRLSVAGPDDRGLFRVRSPVVRTRQEALALQEKLRGQGYRGIVGAVN
jgi:DedD protein